MDKDDNKELSTEKTELINSINKMLLDKNSNYVVAGYEDLDEDLIAILMLKEE